MHQKQICLVYIGISTYAVGGTYSEKPAAYAWPFSTPGCSTHCACYLPPLFFVFLSLLCQGHLQRAEAHCQRDSCLCTSVTSGSRHDIPIAWPCQKKHQGHLLSHVLNAHHLKSHTPSQPAGGSTLPLSQPQEHSMVSQL